MDKIEEEQSGGAFTGKQLPILDAAERLFAQHGFEGTSVRDIALEARVNVAMISYYFGSKEKLLEALFVARISASRLVLEHLLNDKSLEPVTKIEHLIDSIVDRMISHQAFYRVMLRAQLDGHNESVSRIIGDMKLKNLELVTKLVQEGQRKKIFVKGIDVAMMMTTIIGTIYQAAAGSLYFSKAMETEAVSGQEYVDIVKKRLKKHLKHVFKATLIYDSK